MLRNSELVPLTISSSAPLVISYLNRWGVFSLILSAVIVNLALSDKANPQDYEKNNDVRIGVISLPINNIPFPADSIRKYVFEQGGFDTQFVAVPIKRLPYALKSAHIDTTYSSEAHILEMGDVLRAELPDIVYIVEIFFRRDLQWKPSWPPGVEFKSAHGVSKNAISLNREGLHVTSVTSFTACVQMVVKQRSDYCVDIFPTARFDPELHTIFEEKSATASKQVLFSVPLFMVFPKTKQGAELKRVYDLGFKRLVTNEKKYRELYHKNIANSTDLTVFNAYTQYMKSNYPHIFNQ